MDVAHSGKFFGVYLLCSQSIDARFSGKCYIGFTVNPNRRINQHNMGHDFGGAKKTDNKGPWKMVVIVHGFPNNIAALQFEWAWQQPTKSTRLKNFMDIRCKRAKESQFNYSFRILYQMLTTGPWCRLPLVIKWLEPNYEREFMCKLPAHMKVVSAKAEVTSLKCCQNEEFIPHAKCSPTKCNLCLKQIFQPKQQQIGCLNLYCNLKCHTVCLANYMLVNEHGHYIPINGICPICETALNWGELLEIYLTSANNGQ